METRVIVSFEMASRSFLSLLFDMILIDNCFEVYP